MAIENNTFTKGAMDFSRFKGAGSTTSKTTEDRPKAQLWLNLGVETGDEQRPFLSLPQGIPLDTQEREKTNSSNRDYAEFAAAKNALLDQLIEAAKDLQPGESMIVPLSVELRRVNGEQVDVPLEQNKYARNLFAS